MRKWKNEEMETLVRAKPWVMYWQKIDRLGKGGLVFMVLVVWPAKLFS